MTRRAFLPVLLAVAVASVGAAGQLFRGGTDTVLLSVTVTDASGRLVSGLQASDFEVFDNGVPQKVSVFASDPQPISLSLLIDSSTSMERKIGIAQEAAVGFCRRLGPNDQAQVISFSGDTRVHQTFTGDQAALERAIREIRTGGSTSLYTALYIALAEFKKIPAKRPDEIRRQAIVVLSDGEDTTSLLSYDDVLESAKRAGIAVYAIGLRGQKTAVNRFSQADYVLHSLSQTTGGRLFYVNEIAELPAIYEQIADELANQYIIGYIPSNLVRDGAWRQVAVRLGRAGAVARTKSGYFAPRGDS